MTLRSEAATIGQRLLDFAHQLRELVQTWLQQKPRQPLRIQLVFVGDVRRGSSAIGWALAGLLKTAHLENGKLLPQVIEIETGEREEGLAEKLAANLSAIQDVEISYRAGQRYVRQWEETASWRAGHEQLQSPWKDGGVYLISGGAGGLGRIVTREIGAQVREAKIVLLGRSELGGNAMEELQRSAAVGGGTVEYHRVDIGVSDALDKTVHAVVAQHGRVDGVVHAAGVLRDSYLLKKTTHEMHEVLHAKVAGALNLDWATRGQRLDFFVMFSSLAGMLGNVGQADYAVGNAFLDHFAEHRETLVASGERHGRTRSLAWPFWAAGGMQIDALKAAELRELGLEPLSAAPGMAALYAALYGPHAALAVLSGDAQRLRQRLLKVSATAIKVAVASSVAPTAEPLRDKLLYQLKVALGATTKLPPERVDPSEPLETYGIDSVVIMRMNHLLGQFFPDLSKTLFYEYPTLGGVCDFLISEYRSQCAEWCGIPGDPAHGVAVQAAFAPVRPAVSAHVPNSEQAIVEDGELEPGRGKKQSQSSAWRGDIRKHGTSISSGKISAPEETASPRSRRNAGLWRASIILTPTRRFLRERAIASGVVSSRVSLSSIQGSSTFRRGKQCSSIRRNDSSCRRAGGPLKMPLTPASSCGIGMAAKWAYLPASPSLASISTVRS